MIEPVVAADLKRRVYVIDDDQGFRDSVCALLTAVGWLPEGFGDAKLFLDAQEHLGPGPLLLDVRMPGLNGVRLLEVNAIRSQKFPVIVVTGHGDIETAVRALKAGAADFLEKPFTAPDIIQALEVAHSRISAALDRGSTNGQSSPSHLALTSRETEILQGLAAGLQYKVLAHRLGISPRTVEMHRDKILKKLNVRTNAQAIRVAVLAGIDPLEKESDG